MVVLGAAGNTAYRYPLRSVQAYSTKALKRQVSIGLEHVLAKGT